MTVRERRYANCQKVILVCDNLNTHTISAFHEAFEPERARLLVRGIDWHMKISDARCKLKSVYPKIKTRRGSRWIAIR